MKNYRVKLDDRPGKQLGICPRCNHKELVYIITSETHQVVGAEYGRCNREDNCGYDERPSNALIEFLDNGDTSYSFEIKEEAERVYIPEEILERTLKNPMDSSFAKSLLKPFSAEAVEAVQGKYFVGTQTLVWDGIGDAVTFPLIDEHYRIQGIQLKRFNIETGSTIHGSENWVHCLPFRTNQDWVSPYKLQRAKTNTMFGTHLLSEFPDNDVIVFESPKNAIYSALYNGYDYANGDPINVSVLSASTLNADRCKALKNRNVVLMPDTSTDGKLYYDWETRGNLIELELGGYTNIQVSSFLEDLATPEQKVKGYDFADYVRDLFMC